MFKTLISASELAARIDDPTWVVVDCRHDLVNLAAGRDGYAAGHLPNAVFADIETVLSGAKRGPDGVFLGRHPLPGKEALAEALRRFGIGDDTQVVAYDAHGGMFAARLWWLLRWLATRRSRCSMAAWPPGRRWASPCRPRRPPGRAAA